MEPTHTSALGVRNLTIGFFLAMLSIIPINTALYFKGVWGGDAKQMMNFLPFFGVLAALQTLLGMGTLIAGIIYARRLKSRGESMAQAVVLAVLGLFGAVGGVAGGVAGVGAIALAAAASMGGWGRPLRIQGRILHPELREGSDWTQGAQPDTEGLDPAARTALEAFWLHDAQKEHASVPAFARVAWTLIAAGAPADLVERTFTAAQEEIKHTRICFALAAGYGGRSLSVESMPELLVSGLDIQGNVFVHLAIESLNDGCLLEDFNADIASAGRDACQEPTARAVLDCIAREERSHAELSWSILEFCLERGGAPARNALLQGLVRLDSIPRPAAVSAEKRSLIDPASSAVLRAHGRLPDDEWAVIYQARLACTKERLGRLLEGSSSGTLALA